MSATSIVMLWQELQVTKCSSRQGLTRHARPWMSRSRWTCATTAP